LLRQWPRVVTWINDHRHALRTQSQIRFQTIQWEEGNRCNDLLIPPGVPAHQARALRDMPGFTLGVRERDYIDASLRRIKTLNVVRLTLLSMVFGLSILAGAMGIVAWKAQQQSERMRGEAESLMSFMLGSAP
jgi:hypothetical protein